MLSSFFASIADKLIAMAGALLVVRIPAVRAWLNRWPLESAILISTALTLTLIYLTMNRLSVWPGEPQTFRQGNEAGWGTVFEPPFISTCPNGTYAVGIKWWGLINHGDCERCASKMEVICKPLNTLPKLTVE
ncbi:hypothetical protein [Bradyrhizobium sp. SZCCHNRI3043]|uniref:hypothetical protein n=1 Tax=Bradyrhizobium sp. SZCCHNRI3043 TaxID=3057292 RepID=UPI0028ECDC0F|nr:hypothetical protein [Bradyrhizobium sp. SZCCHNRI3043]